MGKKNPFPPERHAEALSAAGYECKLVATGFPSKQSCSGGLVVHHMILRGAGGSRDTSIHDLENLMVLCDSHHKEAHDQPRLSYEHGVMVRRNR